MILVTKTTKPDNRERMYFRVDPAIRRRFKALAELSGETMERRAERLMREDVAKHLPALTK